MRIKKQKCEVGQLPYRSGKSDADQRVMGGFDPIANRTIRADTFMVMGNQYDGGQSNDDSYR